MALTAPAATVVSQTFMVATAVPDNSIVGLADTRTLASGITQITEVTLEALFSGGWNGDLYAYLAHGSGFCVLLNRPGRTASLRAGSPSSGLAVLFADSAAADIHTAIPNTGPVTGTYQPDAREMFPTQTVSTSPRTAYLASFAGIPASGEWTLFVADMSLGSTTVLESWTLTITGVPEPSTSLLVVSAAWLVLRRRRL